MQEYMDGEELRSFFTNKSKKYKNIHWVFFSLTF